MSRSRALAAVILVALGVTNAGAQNKTIAPGDNLVIDGVPAIPASLPEEVRRYTESRAASFADWHPVNREMLISTRFGNTPQIHHVKLPGGARTQLTFFNEPIGARQLRAAAAAATSFSARTSAATSSISSTATMWPTADVTLLTDGGTLAERQRRRGARRATASRTARRAATAPIATSTS